MSKKEDNRDVFEKALDYAPAVGGAVVGGMIGRKIAGRAGKKHRKYYEETKRNQDEIQDAYDSAPPGYWDADKPGRALGNPLSSGEVERVRRIYGQAADRSSAAKMIGTFAGGAAGAATGHAIAGKRRK